MNLAHVHLLLNHLPIVGTLGVALLLAIALGRRSDETLRIGFLLLGLVGVAGLAAYFTGEPAEEIVENLAGISKPDLESHEDLAKIATVALTLLGLGSLIAYAMVRRRAVPRWVAGALLAGALTVGALMAATAWRGGHIRHSEIRGNAPAAIGTDGRDR